TSQQIFDQMDGGKITKVQACLQQLTVQKRVIEVKTNKGKQYQIRLRESFEEALEKIEPQNEVEKKTVAHPTWVEGAHFGKIRKGHPEGQIIYHILEVLDNVKKWHENDPELRLLALLHDTFKHLVNPNQSKYGENHHGKHARDFASQFIQDEEFL